VSGKLDRQNTVINECEDFLKEYDANEMAITSEARTSEVIRYVSGRLGTSKQNLGSFAELIGKAIARYKFLRDSSILFAKADAAYDLLDLIERGKALGFIVPQNLMAKLKECQDENKQLKELKLQLESEISKLKEENKKLNKLVDNLGGRPTSTLE